jgi:hypothetical protein
MARTLLILIVVAATTAVVAQEEGWVVHTVTLTPDGTGAAFGRFHNENGRGELVLRSGEKESVLRRASVVRDIAFAPDGAWLVTTADSGKLHRTSTAGKELGTLDLGHVAAFVRGVAVSGDGARIAAVDDEHRLTVFAVADGRRLFAKKVPDLPLVVAFLPDGRIATGDNKGTLTLWSAAGERESRKPLLSGNLMALAIDAQGRKVAAGGWNGDVAVLDLASGEVTKRAAGVGRIYALAFDETGRLAIAGGAGGVVVRTAGGADRRIAMEPTIGSLRFKGGEVVGADYRGGVHRWAAFGIADLAWLEGTWAGKMWGGRFVAWYGAPSGGRLVSYSRLMKDGKVAFYEFEVFEMAEGKVALRPFPGGKPAVGLTATGIDPKARNAVFENPDKDFPTRIVYHRTADDRLVITLSDPHGGRDKIQTFDLKRE